MLSSGVVGKFNIIENTVPRLYLTRKIETNGDEFDPDLRILGVRKINNAQVEAQIIQAVLTFDGAGDPTSIFAPSTGFCLPGRLSM